MTRTLFIISGGIEAVDAIKRARDMGLHVVVSDMDANAPGFAYAHDRLIADVYGAEETNATQANSAKSMGCCALRRMRR